MTRRKLISFFKPPFPQPQDEGDSGLFKGLQRKGTVPGPMAGVEQVLRKGQQPRFQTLAPPLVLGGSQGLREALHSLFSSSPRLSTDEQLAFPSAGGTACVRVTGGLLRHPGLYLLSQVGPPCPHFHLPPQAGAHGVQNLVAPSSLAPSWCTGKIPGV